MPHTPITDQVREGKGDYLAAVEELELSHAELLAALEGASVLDLVEASVSSTCPLPRTGQWF